jgi:hypothetical protein
MEAEGLRTGRFEGGQGRGPARVAHERRASGDRLGCRRDLGIRNTQENRVSAGRDLGAAERLADLVTGRVQGPRQSRAHPAGAHDGHDRGVTGQGRVSVVGDPFQFPHAEYRSVGLVLLVAATSFRGPFRP